MTSKSAVNTVYNKCIWCGVLQVHTIIQLLLKLICRQYEEKNIAKQEHYDVKHILSTHSHDPC